jgi:hypothetical protein
MTAQAQVTVAKQRNKARTQADSHCGGNARIIFYSLNKLLLEDSEVSPNVRETNATAIRPCASDAKLEQDHGQS